MCVGVWVWEREWVCKLTDTPVYVVSLCVCVCVCVCVGVGVCVCVRESVCVS